MADDEKAVWPERNDNILADTSQPEDDAEASRPHMSTGSSTEAESLSDLQRVQSNRSVSRHQTFEPIAVGDREALHRLASTFSTTAGGSLTRTSTKTGEKNDKLRRTDTLHGVKMEDAVMDPSSEEFDAYVWSRMYEEKASSLPNRMYLTVSI